MGGLTKHQVKMAGYWRFFWGGLVYGPRRIRVHKHAKKKNKAKIQPS